MKCTWIAVLSMVLMLSAGCGSNSVKIGEEFDPGSATDAQILVFAARDGDVDILENYLKQYPELTSSIDSSGNLLIHHAAMAGQKDVVKLLVEKGADINALNYDELTPLAAAMDRKADPSMIEYLESSGGVE